MANKGTRTTRNASRSRARAASVESIDEFLDDVNGQVDNNDEIGTKQLLEKLQNSKKNAKKQAQSVILAKKTALYAEARSRGKDISQRGAKYLEDAREQIQAFRAQETSMEKSCAEYEELMQNLEESYERLCDAYPLLFKKVGPRRSQTIDAVSCSAKSSKPKRDAALRMTKKAAGKQLAESKKNAKDCTDSAELVKSLKSLLRY